MAAQSFRRKLTTILHADVKGYSRMMGEDEEATVRTVSAYMEIMSAHIQKFRGRVVGGAGDSMLAEFTSVVNAVKCAVEIQDFLKAENTELTEDRRVVFRIGINLGDVIEKDGDLLGDGVNIAARVEALADGGGVSITKSVYDQVKRKLPFEFQYLGEHTVKNIAEPIRVYQVLTDAKAADKPDSTQNTGSMRPRLILFAIIFLVLTAGGLAFQMYYRTHVPKPQIEAAPEKKTAFPLPDKPSLAVLPFVNMSADPNQEYFSDGMTEDLITDLSKISGLFVIARNSTFTYKGKPVKIQQVAEELGVRYVLEGSVRKQGETLRINAQLIDGITGLHIWADRFDGQHEDIFALQDRFTRKIVAALAVTLTKDDRSLLARKDTANVSAHDAYMQGLNLMRRDSPESLVKAVDSFKKAVEIDPDFSRAHTALSLAYNHAMKTGWDIELAWFDASSLSQKHMKLAMKNPTPHGHREASGKHLYKREYKEAITEADLALTLGPNDPESQWAMGRALVFAGKTTQGIEYLNQAIRLNPSYPGRYALHLGIAKYLLGHYEEALILLEKAEELEPSGESVFCSNSWLAAAYAQLGQEKEAVEILEENFTKKRTWFYGLSIEGCFPVWPLKELKDFDHYADGLIKAGFPVPWNPVYRRKYEEAFIKAEALLKSAPNDSKKQTMMAEVLIMSGRPVEAIDFIKKIMIKNPKPHYIFWFDLGLAQFCTEQFDEAVKNFEKYHMLRPYGRRMWFLAAAYAHLGRQKEAENAIVKSKFGREYIDFTVENVVKYMNFPFKNQKHTELFADGLRKAGLPEK